VFIRKFCTIFQLLFILIVIQLFIHVLFRGQIHRLLKILSTPIFDDLKKKKKFNLIANQNGGILIPDRRVSLTLAMLFKIKSSGHSKLVHKYY